jgi:nucleoside-diphosphate-sugar epimerase
MNLVIGNSSQLYPYFLELNPNIVGISSRSIDTSSFKEDQFDRAFLTFAEQRTFLNQDLKFFTDVNVDYTMDTIVKLSPFVKTFVVYSTSELWNGYGGGITIDMPYNYTGSLYIKSKEMMEYRLNLLRQFGVDIKIIYPFNFNSPYRKPGFLFSNFMGVILHGKKITVGDLNFYRDITHPKEIVEASLTTQKDVIVGSGKLINVRQFYIDLLAKFSIIYEDYVTEDTNMFVNTREPYYLLSNQPYNNLLEDTFNDIKKFKDSIS